MRNPELFEREQSALLAKNTGFIAKWISPSLFFFFLIADFYQMPQHIMKCFMIRSAILPVCLVTVLLLRKYSAFRIRQIIGMLFTLGNALIIEFLVRLDGGFASNYFCGLILVIIGGLAFIPLDRRNVVLTGALIIIGHNLSCLVLPGIAPFSLVVTSNFFLAGACCLSLITRYFFYEYQREVFLQKEALTASNEQLDSVNKQLAANEKVLQENIIERDRIIKEKTEENLRLHFLKGHFSPHVIHAIQKNGLGRLDSEFVCVMFVDIVDSTGQQQKIAREFFAKIISDFIDQVSSILMKHNITIDKFLGDGILAYSNHPIRRADYLESMCLATLEILDHYERNRLTMSKIWGTDFAIRIGIDGGPVTVGSFGKEHQHYTVIGDAVGRAQRVCSAAETNQILLSNEMHKRLNRHVFNARFAKKANLKGFSDSVDLYELASASTGMEADDACPNGHGPLTMAQNKKRIMVLMCLVCGYEEGDPVTHSKSA